MPLSLQFSMSVAMTAQLSPRRMTRPGKPANVVNVGIARELAPSSGTSRPALNNQSNQSAAAKGVPTLNNTALLINGSGGTVGHPSM
ncbi:MULTISPECIES: hypothetical protein [unclassified Sphingobium]|uniref:hypothetical protein n=1 Tax=unclassified Sphingobium TaxID=2611147 RepID=UPI000AFDFF51|nr:MULTISPECIES: hypothetical protein [unclassified Sphingobium]